MKKLTILLALLMLTMSTVGCGCCRRLRDRLCRGAYCGPAAAVTAPAALTNPLVAAPAPMQAPVQTPIMAPAPVMMAPQPMVTNCIPCDPCCIPCDPCCDPCGGGYSGYYYGGGMPMQGGVYDSGWSTGCNDCTGGNDYLGEPATPQPTLSDDRRRDPGPNANDPSL